MNVSEYGGMGALSPHHCLDFDESQVCDGLNDVSGDGEVDPSCSLDAGSGFLDSEIRPCLIGGFRRLKSIPRFLPNTDNSQLIYSVDKVRTTIQALSPEHAAQIVERFEVEHVSWSIEYSCCRVRREGRYRHLWTIRFDEDTTLAFGLGKIDGKCRETLVDGFLEFNPNKCCFFSEFFEFLRWLAPHVLSGELIRWDLAVDMYHRRDLWRVAKDRRRYEFCQGSALTEYLGIRNAPWRFKLYDKTADWNSKHKDSQIDEPIVRLELTCNNDLADIFKHWPTVYRPVDSALESLDGFRDVSREFVLCLSELLAAHLPIEHHLKHLIPRTRQKIRAALTAETVKIDPECVTHCLRVARWFSEPDRWLDINALVNL
jgi:hypothetical protein